MTDQASPQALKSQAKGLIREAALIAGRWRPAGDDAIAVTSPTDEAAIGRVPKLAAEEVNAAIEAAAGAFPDWAGRNGKARAEVLTRWAALELFASSNSDWPKRKSSWGRPRDNTTAATGKLR